jgi:hypothetical protein
MLKNKATCLGQRQVPVDFNQATKAVERSSPDASNRVSG